jgi:hypothetical protein
MPRHLFWGCPLDECQLKPGKTLNGFSFKSPYAPGLVQYNFQGATGVPEGPPVKEGDRDDEPLPNCPGWDFDAPRFKTLVTGLTTGPVNPGRISVAIRLREEKSERACGAMTPANPTGRVRVVVLGTKDFDPAQIDVSTLRLGPNEALPLSSKLGNRRDEDDRDDDREEWERHKRAIDPDRDAKHKNKNLHLVFDQAALGVQCVLDKAIFLKGKTKTGQEIFGGASTRFVGCDVKRPGVHKHLGSH